MSTRDRAARAVLFDLDGTLLDTAPDMGAALNALRMETGLEPLAPATIRPHVSHGSAALIHLAFGERHVRELDGLRARFLDLYRARLACDTRLFAGGEWTLTELERRGLPWGVVTNKPGWLTEPLLEALGLADRAGCVIAGDTLPERKPHPRPLLLGAERLATHPSHCVYVGDAERDMVAARAAGMVALVAGFGYIGDWEGAERWPQDGWLHTPEDLIAWLESAPPSPPA